MSIPALPIPPDVLLARLPPHLVGLVRSSAVRLLEDGSLRFTRLSNHHPGSIAGWLQPAPDTAAQHLPEISKSLMATRSLATLGVGLQAVNIAVNVAGFAIVVHKLNRIESKLDAMSVKVDQLRAEVLALGATVDAGFERLDRRYDRRLFAESRAAIQTVGDLLAEGLKLDSGVPLTLNKLTEELIGELPDAIMSGHAERAVLLVEALENVRVAHAMMWAGQGSWDQALTTLDRVDERRARLEPGLVAKLIGGAPSAYIDAPGVAPEKLSVALRLVYPRVPGDKIIDHARRVSGFSGPLRTRDLGNQAIPVAFEASPEVVGVVPDLTNEGAWRRFSSGAAAQVDRAARVSASQMMVSRTRDILVSLRDTGARHAQLGNGVATLDGLELQQIAVQGTDCGRENRSSK